MQEHHFVLHEERRLGVTSAPKVHSLGIQAVVPVTFDLEAVNDLPEFSQLLRSEQLVGSVRVLQSTLRVPAQHTNECPIHS